MTYCTPTVNIEHTKESCLEENCLPGPAQVRLMGGRVLRIHKQAYVQSSILARAEYINIYIYICIYIYVCMCIYIYIYIHHGLGGHAGIPKGQAPFGLLNPPPSAAPAPRCCPPRRPCGPRSPPSHPRGSRRRRPRRTGFVEPRLKQ